MSGLGFGVSLEPLDPKSHDEDDQDTIQRYKNISDSAIAAPTILSAWKAIQSDALSASARRLAESMLKTPDDNAKVGDDTGFMNDITREELDAKLDATNSKVEARLSSFESMIRETLAAVRQDSAEMRGELKVMHSELGGLKNIKGSIWGAAGATIIGVGGILAAMLSYGVANYDTGRETSQLVEAAKLQTQDTRKLLEQIQAQQKSLATPETAAPPAPAK